MKIITHILTGHRRRPQVHPRCQLRDGRGLDPPEEGREDQAALRVHRSSSKILRQDAQRRASSLGPAQGLGRHPDLHLDRRAHQGRARAKPSHS